MRSLILIGAMTLAFAGIAQADDKADAVAQCVAIGKAQAEQSMASADQQAQMEEMTGKLCSCVADKVAAMGDDGAKVLRVMAKLSPEKAAESVDPAKDKANTVAILVAEFGMSEADAGAFYDRLNPEVAKASQSCTEEVMKAAAPPAP